MCEKKGGRNEEQRYIEKGEEKSRRGERKKNLCVCVCVCERVCMCVCAYM